MDRPEISTPILHRLKGLGVKLSIDDFGAGYSSLSYLRNFPVDTIKVDQSFIKRMGVDPENTEIVRAVIALAHSLGLDVVAEGIEIKEQCSILTNLDCESGQGFWFSRPLDEDKVREIATRDACPGEDSDE